MRDAVAADIVDEREKVTTETPAQEAEENEVEVNEVTASPSSLAQLYAMLRPIQESAFLCHLPDASIHLQRFLHAFREAIRKSKATAQREMLITEMLLKRPEVFLLIKFCQHELVRIRNSAEIAALYEGSTVSRPPVERSECRLTPFPECYGVNFRIFYQISFVENFKKTKLEVVSLTCSLPRSAFIARKVSICLI